MRRCALLWVIPVVFIILAPQEAHACEVAPPGPTVQEAREDSDAIFSGKVSEFRIIATNSGMQDLRAALFEVGTYWKSDVGHYKELVVFTAIDHGACGYDFEVGKSYVVYATTRDGSLHTSIGSRTMPIQDAQEDLDYLGRGMVPTQQGSWQEQLERIPMKKEPETVQPAENSVMILVGLGAAIASAAAFFSLKRLWNK